MNTKDKIEAMAAWQDFYIFSSLKVAIILRSKEQQCLILFSIACFQFEL